MYVTTTHIITKTSRTTQSIAEHSLIPAIDSNEEEPSKRFIKITQKIMNQTMPYFFHCPWVVSLFISRSSSSLSGFDFFVSSSFPSSLLCCWSSSISVLLRDVFAFGLLFAAINALFYPSSYVFGR